MNKHDTNLIAEAYQTIVEQENELRTKIQRYAELSDPEAELTDEEYAESEELEKWAEEHGVSDKFTSHGYYAHFPRNRATDDSNIGYKARRLNPMRTTKAGKGNRQDVEARKRLLTDLSKRR